MNFGMVSQSSVDGVIFVCENHVKTINFSFPVLVYWHDLLAHRGHACTRELNCCYLSKLDSVVRTNSIVSMPALRIWVLPCVHTSAVLHGSNLTAL